MKPIPTYSNFKLNGSNNDTAKKKKERERIHVDLYSVKSCLPWTLIMKAFHSTFNFFTHTRLRLVFEERLVG